MSKLQDYINNFYPDVNNQPIKLGLDRASKVKDFAKIEPNFPIIIVGGTNGKGSVCAFLEKIYSKADFRIKCHSLRSNEIVDRILKLYENSGN